MGGFWGGLMWWWSLSERTPEYRIQAIFDLLRWALGGLFFGILVTFHWRAFHRPLVFLTAPLTAAMPLMGLIARKALRQGRDAG
jgi:hypothetical protein